jgi:lipoprotein-releasing system ATP-binding protein
MSGLTVSQVRKTYPTPAEELVVLDGVDLHLMPGQNAAIVGPSGSGKSTLLSILGALEPPTSGSVRLSDIDPYSLSEPEQAKFRNQKIGFIFQEHHLLPQWNVLENVLVPALAFGSPSPAQRERGRELLDRVGLTSRTKHLPSQLSGGEKARVAVARALLLKPELVLADEPTGNLDEANSGRIGDLLLEMPQQEGAVLVVVTHSAELAARMERIFKLRAGKLQLSS